MIKLIFETTRESKLYVLKHLIDLFSLKFSNDFLKWQNGKTVYFTVLFYLSKTKVTNSEIGQKMDRFCMCPCIQESVHSHKNIAIPAL